MQNEFAIMIRGLTKRYQQLTAVDNLNLDIRCSSIFGFLGPNGAGKTTTIRMLLGLVTPTAGTATILGYHSQRDRLLIAPKIGAIVETPSFYNYLTGEQNLKLLAYSSNHDLPAATIHNLLERVGLNGRAQHKVRTYSLGMKQRLGIAATLLTDPEIIFLDEPTNGLDPAGVIEMRQLIRQLGSEGFTVFLSSHLLNEVEQICTDVAIIQHGVVHKQGRVQDLLAVGSRFDILAAPFERAWSVLCQYPELHPRSDDNEWIRVVAAEHDIPAIVRTLVSADVDVYQLQSHRNSLEEVFLTVTDQSAQIAAAAYFEETAR